MKFTDFGFRKELEATLEKIGFVEPSPIQIDAIPIVSAGKDMVGQAQTGTGKTAAFGLPLINKMDLKSGVELLVVVPTRELATQVSDELFRFGKDFGVKTTTIYGGSSYSRQLTHLKTSNVVVATPGRLIDLLTKHGVKLSPKFVVLDEADEMLDMGFLDDIKEIFKFIPEDRQTLLFSATMAPEIKKLAQVILKEPEFVTITKSEVTNSKIEQLYYVVEEYERDDALSRLLDYYNPFKSIIFTRTKREADRLSTMLVSQGYGAKGLHGDMEQRQREEVIKSFKSGQLEILVATDVAARGLDVNDVSHVINYHIPLETESYVHRIGRTGRAGKTGIAISIVTPSEFRGLNRIEKHVGTTLKAQVVPTLGELKNHKNSKLLTKIENQEVSNDVYALIDNLKETYDISTLTYKLLSIVLESENKTEGRDKIGKGLTEIESLVKRAKSGGFSRGGGRSGGGFRGGNRSGYRGSRDGSSRSGFGNRSGGESRSSGGYRGSRDGGSSRSSGGYRGARDGSSRDAGSNKRRG
ncbi:MAG: DEAD/DEAH box helicase [Candidatus Gracilibacteria bacterium]|nr:DEAD/DEAH box helicase [Candidatus Gracilibacteria bacterium]